jgi:hypothetical protein
MSGNEDLPESMCKVFWTVLFGWFFMATFAPITLLTVCFRGGRRRPYKYGLNVIWLTLMVSTVGAIFATVIMHTTWLEFLYGLLEVVGAIVLGGVSLFGFVSSIVWLRDKFKRELTLSELHAKLAKLEKEQAEANKPIKADGFLKLGWKAFMGKYCPKVDWV